jgi:hypothetical protein
LPGSLLKDVCYFDFGDLAIVAVVVAKNNFAPLFFYYYKCNSIIMSFFKFSSTLLGVFKRLQEKSEKVNFFVRKTYIIPRESRLNGKTIRTRGG